MIVNLPHPIPYQGSKRRLAEVIGSVVPRSIGNWYEPFAGSAAMTIWIARHRDPERIIIGDSLVCIAGLWKSIIDDPVGAADRYEAVWNGQRTAGMGYFNEVRDRYNDRKDPVDLLYLMARCVKNAVRFNRKGHFTQSVDKRRLGMKPEKMRKAMLDAGGLLRGRTIIRAGDWTETISDARQGDFIYLDPPYMGTSSGRDLRYAEQMTQQRLIVGLEGILARRLSVALSYDGRTGEKVYGPPLPSHLNMSRILINTGRSSQSTLSGRAEETVESLYLSADLEASSHAIRVGYARAARQPMLFV